MQDDTNSLSDDEQQRLLEIEDGLQREDPALAEIFAPQRESAAPDQITRRLGPVAPVVGVVVGIIMLVAGLVVPAPIIGAVGFAVLVVSTSSVVATYSAAVVDRFRTFTGFGREDPAHPDGDPPAGRDQP